jgi:hypothetical protein
MSDESPAIVNFQANAAKHFVFCKESGKHISKQLVHGSVCFDTRNVLFASSRREPQVVMGTVCALATLLKYWQLIARKVQPSGNKCTDAICRGTESRLQTSTQIVRARYRSSRCTDCATVVPPSSGY